MTSGLVPRSLPWVPQEVLALTRWQSGERTDHMERALASLLVCLVPDDLDELAVNGVILVESCIALGEDVVEQAERFFAWKAATAASTDDDLGDDDRVVARLLLLLLRASRTPADARLPALARTIASDAAALAAVAEEARHGMRAEIWRDLVAHHLGPLVERIPDVARLVEALGLLE